MLSTLRRSLAAALACLALLATLGASSASADRDVFNFAYWRTVGPGLSWITSNPHNITDNVSIAYQDVCVGAIDYYGGALSGAGYCANWAYGTQVDHPYCGCVFRDGADYPDSSGANGYVAEAYVNY